MSVVRLDLRESDSEGALARVDKILRDERDVRYLLVTDSVDGVRSHRAAFEALDRSRRIGRLLCVVVGRSDVPPLRLPGNIERRTLWVIDSQGIDWPLVASAPVVPRQEDGLAQLTEVLQAEEVFTGTHAALEEIPYGAAVPGLRLADLSGVGQMEFVHSLLVAAKRLLEPMGTTPKPLEPAKETRIAVAKLTPGGPIQARLARTEIAVAEVRDLVDELPSPSSILRQVPIREAFQDAGTELDAARTAISGLLAETPSGVRITQDRLAAVTALGVTPPTPDEYEPAAGSRNLAAWLTGCLRDGSSLGRLGDSLQERIRILEQSRVDTQAMDRICPPTLVTRLTHPAPFPAPQPLLPLAGLVCAALAGLSPALIGGGLVMALLWTMLVALTIIRGPGGRIDQEAQRALSVNAVAAVAGAIGGGLLSGAIGPPDIIWGLAVLAGLVGAVLAISYSWSTRAGQWVTESRFEEAQRAIDLFPQLVTQATTEWATANARLDEADALNRLRQALTGSRDSIKDFAERNERDLRGAPSRPAEAFREKINRWLQDTVLEAVKPTVSGRDPGLSNEVRKMTKATMTMLLADWEKRAEDGKAAEPLSYHSEFEPTARGTATEDLVRLAREVSRDPADEMWQLCAADDLGLLDTGKSPGTVRFVPAGSVFDVPLPAETVRSGSGGCGLIRLVALHPRVVEWTWHDAETDDQHGGVR